MTQPQPADASSSSKKLHLIGIGVGHSIAPIMHNHICAALHIPWTFVATEASTIEAAMLIMRDTPNFAGAVVTMPYKKSVMAHLDGLDPLAMKLGACNNVYVRPDGKLQGTNTDWRGIKGCLLAASEKGTGRVAMIVGAGGASRAAVYALAVELKCPVIYVANRDDQEVKDLIADTRALLTRSGSDEQVSEIVHLRGLEQARELPAPYYIVGTVPDSKPETDSEKRTIGIFGHYLASAKERGVFLDMCFKPRITMKIKLARQYGWETVEGTEVIGHQIYEQYRVWIGSESDEQVVSPQLAGEAWETLRAAALQSKGINFEVGELDVST
ncbi:shikimate / quinate 5-dehydrogenase like protein [Zymoseptoria brevis]|uniref:Shikimate / quinate 5-dehydrogenase like protein n=1 Tax=Zymoseptoria brevis TaxID=1047168 RepID=A0A0F4G8T0_9PEZI|nr:shikimate / quinate 5-dehydrogenase like protein [Zymoseptoria brevis]